MHESQARLLPLLFSIVAALFFSFAAFGDTPVSDPLTARGAGWQAYPASATDGRDFLLVWQDSRSGEPAIYATRVAADGTVLDPEDILLSGSGGYASYPSVAWTGSSYIVAWQNEGCWFRRLTPDGRVEAGPGRVFDEQCGSPRVAGSGGGTAIIVANRSYDGIQVAAIDRIGFTHPLGEVRSGGLADVACSGSDCLLTWTYGTSLNGRFIGRGGEHFDSPDTIVARNIRDFSIAATSDRFLLVWRHWEGGWEARTKQLWARELDPRFQSPPFVFKETTTPSILGATVSASGRDFIIAWSQDRAESRIDPRPGPRLEPVVRRPASRVEIRVRRLGDGDDGESIVATSSSDLHDHTIVSNGTTHVAAWMDSIYKLAASVVRDGGPVSRIAVTRTATMQAESQVVRCDDHVLVVWTEDLQGNDKWSVLARRFRYSGEPLDVRPILLSSSPSSQRRPAAAFDGESYVIVWSEGERGVRARRLQRDGTLAPEVLALSDLAQPRTGVAVVATDQNIAVLYREGTGLEPQTRLMLTRIGTGSEVARTEVGSSRGGSYALGWNGAELVTVFTQNRGFVHAARITRDGVLLDRDPIRVGFGRDDAQSLSLVCDVSECVAAWREYSLGIQIASIAGGTSYAISEPVHDLSDYHTAPTNRYHPTVVGRNSHYQVVFYGPNGILFTRSIQNGLASPERTLEGAPRIGDDYSAVATPEGMVMVDQRATFGPGYAGARRLYLRQLTKSPAP